MANMEGGCFKKLRVARETEIHHLQRAFDTDCCVNKVNLARYGAWDTTNMDTYVTPLDEFSHKTPAVLKLANKVLAEDRTLNKEYLPAAGLPAFNKAAMDIALGKESPAICENRAFSVQTLSQVGALRVAGEFFVNVFGMDTFYCSEPSFDVFYKTFKAAGFHHARYYRYWHETFLTLDINGLLEDLSTAQENSVIILNVCGHNPTGCDPTKDHWKKIAEVLKKRRLFPVMDISYQGLISGDLNDDAWPIRYFVEQGLELFCIQSFSRNMGLFGDRIGSLTVVVEHPKYMPAVKSQLSEIIEGLYLSPPVHGSRIVTHVLNDFDLFNQWKDHLHMIATRVSKMRRQFREALERTGTPGNWKHITDQTGLFSFTGLSEFTCLYLQQKFHIYMLRNGQISVLGLNAFNIDYVAKSICEAMFQTKTCSKLSTSLSQARVSRIGGTIS